jgi:hypothetical protein
MTVVSSIIAKARIINYDSRIVMYSFILLATVIMIIDYNRTVIMIVNYDCKTFIVQATVIFDGFVETKKRKKRIKKFGVADFEEKKVKNTNDKMTNDVTSKCLVVVPCQVWEKRQKETDSSMP